MKQLTACIFFVCSCVILYFSQLGCANIIPPGGGPRDTIPPILVSAMPKDSSINIKPYKIVLTFNEYIEVKSVSENLVVSPLPKNNPIVDFKLKTVTIKLRDSLEANTTYALDFGNSIVDNNEGNPAKNFTYVFSTGNSIDNNSFEGNVLLAEDGKIDTTLIAVLYKNTNDTAVLKQRPTYIAKLNSKGNFTFNYLPKGNFRLFAMPNDYSKRYDDSTKLFAFADTVIRIGNNPKPTTLYAYEQAKKKPTNNSNSSNKAEIDKDKRLKYSTNLESGRVDLLKKDLIITFSRKVKTFDSAKIILCDTNYVPITDYTLNLDSTKTKLTLFKNWKAQTAFKLILPKDAFIDTTNASFAKSDTLAFFAKSTDEYGSVKIRFNNLDTTKNPVLLIIKDNSIEEYIKIRNKDFSRNLFQPGEYSLRILFDTNNNGIWDAGEYATKKQPEIVRMLTKKLSVRARWDNETEIEL